MQARFNLNEDTLFGNEVAEDERDSEVFESYYVRRDEFKSFCDSNKSMLVANAYKGEGKSALLRATQAEVKRTDPNAVVVFLRSSDLPVSSDSGDYQGWVRSWKSSLMASIAAEVGREIGMAWNADDVAAVEEAEKQGFRRKNPVGVIMERFKLKFKTPHLEAELQAGTTRPSEGQVQRLSENRSIWVFIDDSDQNFQNTKEGHYRVAGLFTASRHLCNLSSTLHVRATIRPTTWIILYREVEDMSHVSQYLVKLEWGIQDIRNVVARRITAYLRRTNQRSLIPTMPSRVTKEEEIISLLFGRSWPWGKFVDGSKIEKPPHVVLSTLSRLRPRWLVELCREAASTAAKREHNSIDFTDVEASLESFGRKRLQNTVSEFSVECAQIESVLLGFSRQPERYRTDELLKTLEDRVVRQVDVRIAGELGRCSALQIAQFLYRIGFLTARLDHTDGSYDHFAFAEKPSLLKNPANRDEGHSWEIHPIFRQALSLTNPSGARARPKRGRGGREGR